MEYISDETISEIKILIGETYPKIKIQKSVFECTVTGCPADGVAVANFIATDTNSIKSGHKNVLITPKIPSTVLGRLNDVVGIVTIHEDPSSHLSIVCRSTGVPVLLVKEEDLHKLKNINGAGNIALDGLSKRITVGDIVVDASTVLASKRKLLEKISSSFNLEIAANADTAPDIADAVKQGFRRFWPRSETMLYEGDTLKYFNALLLEPSNKEIAEKFSERHRKSIQALFFAADGGRVGFRLLDPPSHEFLPDPDNKEEVNELAVILNTSSEDIQARIRMAREQNPMIGHRGARLLLTHETILECQISSSLDAWIDMEEKQRPKSLDILVPFIMHPKELQIVRQKVLALVNRDKKYKGIPVKIGTMVEIPSILFYPEEIAKNADFISYGTNDLVALTHGISRGDSYDRYLTSYIDRGIFDRDPFLILPQGVVENISTFSRRAKQVNPQITADLCGEHAVTTDVIPLLENNALDSVSIGKENLACFAQNLIAYWADAKSEFKRPLQKNLREIKASSLEMK
ncbi:MAG: putative PEP-binding protein [Bdellovibrionales bacterium]